MLKDFAVFIDRDGTINVDVDFLSSPAQLQLIPRSAEAIRELNELDIPIVVITNQSGIARGIFNENDLHLIHRELDKRLAESGANVLAYHYCPHHPSDGIPPYVVDCECRKPKAGMLIDAREKFGFDLKRSFVVGDKCVDVQTGNAVQATAIQVSTGYGTNERELCQKECDYFAVDLYDAVQFIKMKLNERN